MTEDVDPHIFDDPNRKLGGDEVDLEVTKHKDQYHFSFAGDCYSIRIKNRQGKQKHLAITTTDENRARLLRDRLKSFFQLHINTIDTARYRLSLTKNGGSKASLILDESVPVTNLPEQFQKVSIDANTTAIREALEAGEVLPFAHFGERGTSLRIK